MMPTWGGGALLASSARCNAGKRCRAVAEKATTPDAQLSLVPWPIRPWVG